ncbi:MAG: hypothetical protein JZU47_10090 [Prolixibacteraceae bacterium]|nr:hypothetical protein [Prolixibacteraceae bacterium]
MEKLEFNQIIQIYLGEIRYNGMEIIQSKELAYLEIQKRIIEYRKENNVEYIVEKLNLIINELKNIELLVAKLLKIKIVNTWMLRGQFFDLMDYSNDRYHPAKDLLNEYNCIVMKLLSIWENDPEHIRYSSKFNERRTPISSQEYFEPIFFDFIRTPSAKFIHESTAILGFDYLTGIIEHCIDSDICIVPIDADSDYEFVHIINFVVLFNIRKCPESILWFVFFQKPETTNEAIDSYLNKLRTFFNKLTRFSGFTFDVSASTVLKMNELMEWNYDELLFDLDLYASQHVAQKRTGEIRQSLGSPRRLRFTRES